MQNYIENSALREFSTCITPVAHKSAVDTCWTFPISNAIAAQYYIEHKNKIDNLELVPLLRQEAKVSKKGKEVPTKTKGKYDFESQYPYKDRSVWIRCQRRVM